MRGSILGARAQRCRIAFKQSEIARSPTFLSSSLFPPKTNVFPVQICRTYVRESELPVKYRDPPYRHNFSLSPSVYSLSVRLAIWIGGIAVCVVVIFGSLYSYLRNKEMVQNREEVLQKVGGKDGVWQLTHEFVRSGLPVALASTMYVIAVDTSDENGSPGILVYNPVPLSLDTMATLSELGPIRYIVVANREHTKFLLPLVKQYVKSSLSSLLSSTDLPESLSTFHLAPNLELGRS